MEIFAGLALYTLVASLAGWLYCMIAMLNDVDIMRWCKKKGIENKSIPAMILVLAFLWPVTFSLLLIYCVYVIFKFIFSTFASLFSDLAKIVKKR